jgi:N-acetylmuramoyl-L-alanine amidase
VPYPCDYDPYCYDGGLSIIIDPGWGGGNGGGNGGPILPRPTPR